MEAQMRDMCTQIQTMHATLQKTKPPVEHSGGTLDRLFRYTEAAIQRAYNATPYSKGRSVSKPAVKISSTQLPTQQSTSTSGIRASPVTRPDIHSTSKTRDIGVDPMSHGTSLTEAMRPSGLPSPGIATDGETTTCFSAETYPNETPSAFQTAEGTVPRADLVPAARKKEK